MYPALKLELHDIPQLILKFYQLFSTFDENIHL